MKKKNPKLTMKKAKAIAIEEFGSAAGLIADENNNSEYQCFYIKMGNHQIVISNSSLYPGTARVSFGNLETFYDIETLTENYKVSDLEREKERSELIQEMAVCHNGIMFKALVEQQGIIVCLYI